MPKYTKTTVTQLSANEQAALDQINKNFEDIQTAITDSVSRSGSIPSHMTSDLDMNGKRIINVPAPKSSTDLVRQQDVVGDIEIVQQLVNTTTNAAAQTLKAAQEVQEILEDEHVGLIADDLALDENSKIRICGTNIDKITTTANNISNINSVATNESDISAVASNTTNINKVASDINRVDLVADDIDSVRTVAIDISTVIDVADNKTNIDAVAGNETNINTCVSNISAITGASTQAANAANSATAAAQSAQLAQEAALSITSFDLLDHKWSDHLLNDQNWLRADTFSWQDGTVYSDAYNHLVDDYNGGKRLYGWGDFSYWVGTTSATPSVGDSVYAGIPSAVIGMVESVSSGSITVSGTTYPRYSEYDGGLFDKVGSYTIRYSLAADGHKIVMPDQETKVLNIYNESGVAWYYILDTANQRFKLPRENPDKEILFQKALVLWNDGIIAADGSTNLGNKKITTGNYTPNNVFAATGLLAEGGNLATSNIPANSFSTPATAKTAFKADLSSSTGVYKGKQYLYFYVGQFSQSATEQTAGLNAELFNGKVDVSSLEACHVVIETYQNGTEWYRLYDDGWVEQGGVVTGNATDWDAIVTFPIVMNNINYSVKCQAGRNDDSGAGINNQAFIHTFSTTGLVVDLYGDGRTTHLWWEVKGWSAQ